MNGTEVFKLVVYTARWYVFVILVAVTTTALTSATDLWGVTGSISLVLLLSWGFNFAARLEDYRWACTALDVMPHLRLHSYRGQSTSQYQRAVLRIYETLGVSLGGAYVLGLVIPAPVMGRLMHGIGDVSSTKQRVLTEIQYHYRPLPK